MSTVLKILSDEHQNILKITNALLKECDSLQSENEIDKDFLKKAIDFIKGYADKLHHAKEENKCVRMKFKCIVIQRNKCSMSMIWEEILLKN